MGIMDYLKTEDRTKTAKSKDKKKEGLGKKVAKTATSAMKSRKQRLAEAAKGY